MSNWSWTEKTPATWSFLGRVILKTFVLFGLCNLVFAWFYPLEWLGQWSLYGVIYPQRDRLPYGENPSESYNVSLDSIPALFASHQIQNMSNENYNIVLIGDSNTWGWFLENDQTLSAQLNASGLTFDSRQQAVFYNLGYPVLSLNKDLLILDEALNYKPDLILWFVTLRSFQNEQQFLPPLVQNNTQRLAQFDSTIDFSQYTTVSLVGQTPVWQRSIIHERRALADLLRLQFYGVSWLATGIDQSIPEQIPLRQSDFNANVSWSIYDSETSLTVDDLAFDVLETGVRHAGTVPVIIVNEPMFISDGTNSDIRYNSFYPRWAYDQYRELLQQTATDHQWRYHDLWDTITSTEFTDSPVHLTPAGTRQFAQILVGTVLIEED